MKHTTRGVIAYLLVALFLLCFWYYNLHESDFQALGSTVFFWLSMLVSLLPFGCGVVVGRSLGWAKTTAWHIILDVVLILIMLPLGFTGLAIHFLGVGSAVGHWAALSNAGGVSLLFLMLSGILLGRLTTLRGKR